MGQEAQELRKIAEALLLVAGGNLAEASKYYATATGGGSDDIVGMVVSEEQFPEWKALGDKGTLIFGELLSHADDDPMAYGGFCYSLETLVAIKSGIAFAVIMEGMVSDGVDISSHGLSAIMHRQGAI